MRGDAREVEGKGDGDYVDAIAVCLYRSLRVQRIIYVCV